MLGLSLILAARATAPADEAGFAHVRDTGGCSISMRPEGHPDGAAMRAECAWPEVDADRLMAMISAYEDYPRLVFPITLARIERQEADRTLVYQRQEVAGLADREVLLWMQREQTPERLRVSWTTASEEPLAVAPGSVRTPKNVGYWEIVRAPGGGALVVHEIALDAGGTVPRWIVSLVRTRAFARILEDVREIALQAG